MRPFTELATDIANNTLAHYNFITPNICSAKCNSRNHAQLSPPHDDALITNNNQIAFGWRGRA
jgi:hypothetical protein